MIKISVDLSGAQEAVTSKIESLQRRLDTTLEIAANRAAREIEVLGRADIQSGGKFGPQWMTGLHVRAEPIGPDRMKISLTHDVPYWGIFEHGGTIHGNPLLWLPISGRGTSPPNGGLFSARYPRKSGPPLLFSTADKKPSYFGLASVTIQPKFHLRRDMETVMAGFQATFKQAWSEGS